MASAVVDEDADIVGVSFSSAAYVEYTRQLVEAMQRKEMGDVPVMLGGIIHPDDHAELKQIGVRGIFGAASQMHDIRSEEHTSELQSLMRISYAVFCLKKKIIRLKLIYPLTET